MDERSRFSDWLAKHDDINKARCIYCMSVFSVKYDGVNAVQSHSNSKKHILAVKSRQKSTVIKNYFVASVFIVLSIIIAIYHLKLQMFLFRYFI